MDVQHLRDPVRVKERILGLDLRFFGPNFLSLASKLMDDLLRVNNALS